MDGTQNQTETHDQPKIPAKIQLLRFPLRFLLRFPLRLQQR